MPRILQDGTGNAPSSNDGNLELQRQSLLLLTTVIIRLRSTNACLLLDSAGNPVLQVDFHAPSHHDGIQKATVPS